MAIAPRLRHELARRPWLFRTTVAGLAIVCVWGTTSWAGRVDAERARWGASVEVVVTVTDVEPGTVLRDVVSTAEHPLAVVPGRAVRRTDLDDAAIARRAIAAGSVVTDLDLVATAAPHALLGPGEVAVTVTERIASGARLGDRVLVTTEGVVLAEDAGVVDRRDDLVVLAVDRSVGPAIAAAAVGPGGVSLLLRP